MVPERSNEKELIDLGPSYYSQAEYDDCLKQLGRIGTLLGGDRATLKMMRKFPNPQSILDVGCGGGAFTLKLAKQYPMAKVTGIDISSQAIQYAQRQAQLPNLRFEIPASVELSYPPNSFDIVTSTLVCHHMQDDQLIDFLKRAYQVASKGIVLNDLHRHWMAYLSFFLIAKPFFSNRLIFNDGLLSIQRAFKREDWKKYLEAAKIPLKQCSITWHWAFRWIVCIDTSAK